MAAPLQNDPHIRPEPRWTLNRAGIVNVYQYGDETLHFSGGRLLLRGVNGSGKSTAMNMLLPFLLDGDTRRIDAAGEQSGVLRSWMLSGRDEPQPQGYLWIELACGDDYLSFGCGIRANQSTDRVTTWWFVTARRPGIDLRLVEGRVPIDPDALRIAIAPDHVYRQDQRDGYRTELRNRLFGGADLEQHLHLLRIVRNPRVGDRLDTELPQYLLDALPQLSDAALDDAAQPLEDLEEHRRNVGDLERTARALTALQAVYANYARTELHQRADEMLARVDARDRRQRDEGRALAALEEAQTQRDAAQGERERLNDDTERLRAAIAALEASDAYKSGTQLNDLRAHVAALTRVVEDAESSLERCRDAVERSASAVSRAKAEVEFEQQTLHGRLTELAALSSTAHLAARPPGLPSLAIEADGDLSLPAQPIDVAPAQEQLSRLRAAAQHRHGDVQAVDGAVRAIAPVEQSLHHAEDVLTEAAAAHERAQATLEAARREFHDAIAHWRDTTTGWLDALQRHHQAYSLGTLTPPPALADPASALAAGGSLVEPLRRLAEPALAHHQTQLAQCDVTLNRHNEVVEACQAHVAELAERQLPDPPIQSWQRRDGKTCLAELIDFRDDLDPASRAGLEAAMEAAGLLGAEVQSGGRLRLEDGELLATADAEGPAPLTALLRVCVPAGNGAREMAEADVAEADVARILGGISTDADSHAHTVVTTHGEFRLGSLRGRHGKPAAEHIGIAARRATLERQRDEARAALAQACADRDRAAAERAAVQSALDAARRLNQDIPSPDAAIAAGLRRDHAMGQVDATAELLRRRRNERNAAEQRFADAVERARQTAARFALPATLEALAEIRQGLGEVINGCGDLQRELTRLDTAVQRWIDRGADWRVARDDAEAALARRRDAQRELQIISARLAELERMVGESYAKVVAELDLRRGALTAAKSGIEQVEAALRAATGDVGAAGERHDGAVQAREQADAACIKALPVLRGTLAVPGLVDAAMADPAVMEVPTVDETPDGARRLGSAIRSQIPPAQLETSAESVRQSLRQRRDALGAGWDAEDHQPEAALPLHVEVTGPLAPQVPLFQATAIVQSQLTTMSGLLTAKQDQALRNLLQGLIAREVADKLHAAGELIDHMNRRLATITTSHGIGVRLRWTRRDDLDPALSEVIALLAKPPDLRTADEDRALTEALGRHIQEARRDEPDLPYRELIARVLDYRGWHRMGILLQRPGHADERLTRRTALSEGEKKIVSYLPLFAAVAASCDALAAQAPRAPRFVLLDDAFAKVSEDNHPKLFGLLVELDLDFIATSERLWGTHDTVPSLAITEVIRDADLRTIVLEHSRWDGRARERA
ncbi:MAG: TIGR02680 family protein [Pseudomonadales bacterium]